MKIESLRGKFIVIDGPDGAGKSTQAQMLVQYLHDNGLEAELVRDPGGTAIGEKIRAILLDNANVAMSVRCETLLYMASRAQLYHEKIAPALAAGMCVISDRWVSSTYAYQAIAGEDGSELVLTLAEAALERPWPDRTILLDLPSELGLARVGKERDRMESKSLEFHRAVRQAYLDLAGSREDFKVLSASGSVADIHRDILNCLCE
ncbi:MAG: dTMP kinase [Sedimentisphaerales bacterium]|nr:dTMP kinase [Sedimentisphaerales bacterium]MBN2842072.1 dTMP kinase [Sedimentisphaerales bacterium]